MQCLRTTRVFTAAVTQTWTGNGCTGHTRRGTRAGKNVLRHIKTVTNRIKFSDDSNKHRGYGVKQTNLVQIQTNSYQTDTLNIHVRVTNRPKQNNVNVTAVNLSNLKCVTLETKPPNRLSLLSLCTLNCRSMKNKASTLCDYITCNNLDILALTETWLGTDLDSGVIGEAVPQGYGFVHEPRIGKRGGGIALVYNRGLDVEHISDAESFTQFEHMECTVNNNGIGFRLCVIYRPPASKVNGFRKSVFFDEWSRFLDRLVVLPGEIVITGDLNFHLDNLQDSDAKALLK